MLLNIHVTRTPRPVEEDMFRLPALEQTWLLPRRVDVAGGNLVYTLSDTVTAGDEGLLRRFLLLADADDESIANYAHEFGVLGLCMHGLPWTWLHDGENLGRACSEPMREDYERAAAVFAKGRSPAAATAFREPLETWRLTARAYRSVIEMADRIQSRKPSDPHHMAAIAALLPGYGYTRAADMPGAASATKGQIERAQIEWDRWHLTEVLNELLDKAVRATVTYPARTDLRPQMRFAGRSLADALVLQLAMAVCRTGEAATCDGCGTVFVPSTRYKPREGQRRFCDDCRASGVPWKLAARDRRARAKSAKEGTN
jgi:hypothetical protein